MASTKTQPQQSLQGLAKGDRNVLNTLLHMQEGTLRESGLDPQTFMLVRIAALATLDAAPASWMANLELSAESGMTPEKVLGTLVAIAPVIGTARVVSAASKILRALGLADVLAESSK